MEEPLSFDVALSVWLTSIADLTPRTLAIYRQNVDHFAEWCTGQGIAGANLLTPAHLVAYRGKRRDDTRRAGGKKGDSNVRWAHRA